MESDLELLQRSASGDDAAFEAFVARHRAAVFRFARHLTHHGTDAEDVLQQTFVAAWKGAAAARLERGARPWLFTIARHAAARLSRVAAQQPRPTSGDEDGWLELGARAGFGVDDETPQRAATRAEDRELLAAAVLALPTLEREVLVLRDLEGLDGDTVAATLGIGLSAMKSRLHRARLRLCATLRASEGEEA